MDYIKSYFKLFKTPKKYFKSIKPSLQESYTFFLLFYLVFFLLTLLFNVLTFFFDPITRDIFTLLTVPFIVGYFFFSLILGLAMPLIFTLIFHAGLYFVAHKINFKKTFDATTRSHTVLITYSLISAFIAMFLTGFFYTTPYFTLLVTSISTLIALAGVTHYLYAVSEGLSIYHKLPLSTTILSVIVIPLFFVLVILLLLVLTALA